MVSRALSLTLASAALGGLLFAACSAEFGGRCANSSECDGTDVCIQGYCLPEDSPDRLTDGGALDGEPSDGAQATGCDDTNGTPAYDETLRPCADEHTAALWRFDDDFEAEVPAGATPVTLDGAPNVERVKLAAGVAGNAVVFDGVDDPELGATEPLRAIAPLTIELWARPAGQDGSSRTLIGNLDADRDPSIAGGFELYIDQYDPDPTLYQLGFAYAVERSRETYESAATFPAEAWVHLAAVIEEDGAVRLYVDGVEERFAPVPATGRGRDLVFGRRPDGFDVRPYPGALDEVRLSTIARDGATLQRVARDFARPE